MQAFADALVQSGIAEQVIFQNPNGQQTGFPANVNYAGDYGDHTKHVHTRFGQAPGPMDTAGQGQGPMDTAGAYTPPDPAKVYADQTRMLRQKEQVEAARLRVRELEADANADQNDLAKARNDVVLEEREYVSAMMELQQEQQGSYKKLDSSTRSFTEGMQQIGVALDQDLGISKGLPGLAENLVKFLANLAAAPCWGR